MSHIGFSGSCLFYDAFLTDVTTRERMDRVSAWGYAMGYIGGSTIPFVLAIILLFVMGMENPVAFKLVILLTSVWWLAFSIPFLKNVHQIHYVEAKKGLFRSTFRNLWATAKDIFTQKRVFFFIIAYFFYIDGVNTIISISTSYGTTLGLDTVGMILALLVTQIVAMPFSILFGKLAGKVGSINLLCGSVGIYFVITVVGFFMGFNIEQNPAASPPSCSPRCCSGAWPFWWARCRGASRPSPAAISASSSPPTAPTNTSASSTFSANSPR